MRHFKDCKTKEEVKSLYKTLAKLHHPDRGGDTATMQEINKEYAFAIASILKGGSFTAQEVEAEILNAENYKNAINAIINLEGINIELCGGWIWVSGNTRPHKDIFRSSGFYFASKKIMWYFRGSEFKTSNKGKSLEIEGIRAKYGSQQITGGSYTGRLVN